MTSTESIQTNANLLALEPAAQELLFTAARTANTFSAEPVSDEQLKAITELAKWPPTMANTNPLRILFVRSPEGKKRLGPLMNEGNRAKTLSAPAVAILAVDNEFHEKIPELLPYRPELRDAFAGDLENRKRLAKFNGALQAGYFILAVRAAGLAAGPMLGYDAEAIDREFFPDSPWQTILVVNIGKPGVDPWFDRLPRLAHEDFVAYV
ncbi:malonic semialdehyde reductase [Conexibacter sp. S30A1]|jgi:3-hydroxypropanoate dehydrogenase|uniref:malonic semialdehyde reductase n=1 Tax=Conexibacter sp. S30A1 TaxID=2937800 RepID=UPI00200EDFC1|nr:malonic semialdehyde reductase [Conexibacter sp. S30A1]